MISFNPVLIQLVVYLMVSFVMLVFKGFFPFYVRQVIQTSSLPSLISARYVHIVT